MWELNAWLAAQNDMQQEMIPHGTDTPRPSLREPGGTPKFPAFSQNSRIRAFELLKVAHARSTFSRASLVERELKGKGGESQYDFVPTLLEELFV